MTVNEYNVHHIFEDDIPFLYFYTTYVMNMMLWYYLKQKKNKNKKGFGGNCFHHTHLILIIFRWNAYPVLKKNEKKEVLLSNDMALCVILYIISRIQIHLDQLYFV